MRMAAEQREPTSRIHGNLANGNNRFRRAIWAPRARAPVDSPSLFDFAERRSAVGTPSGENRIAPSAPRQAYAGNRCGRLAPDVHGRVLRTCARRRYLTQPLFQEIGEGQAMAFSAAGYRVDDGRVTMLHVTERERTNCDLLPCRSRRVLEQRRPPARRPQRAAARSRFSREAVAVLCCP